MTTAAQTSNPVLAPVAAADALELVDECWTAGDTGGHSLEGGSDTERIVAAAGAVESLEWELDRAQSAFAAAIERAASNGCPVEAIAEAAGLTRQDIATLLWAARSEPNHL